MIVVDIEATGLNPDKHSLLSIGAVDFNQPERQFYEECRIWDGAHIDDAGLAVNGFTREQIVDPNKQTEGDLVKHFLAWAQASEEYTVAGQNPFVDVAFIDAAARRNHMSASLHHRIIDMHSICFAHMARRGLKPKITKGESNLNSDAIMVYVGIPAEPHPHVGLNGAKWEAEALSRLIYDRSLLPEFSKYPVPWLNEDNARTI